MKDMARTITIDLSDEDERLLSREGITAEQLLRERLSEASRKEVDDWWNSLPPSQRRTVYEASR